MCKGLTVGYLTIMAKEIKVYLDMNYKILALTY